MQHMFIFFYLAVLLIGAGALAVSGFVYHRTRDRLVGHYMLYISSMTLYVLSFLFAMSYANLNLADVSFSLVLLIVSVSVASFALMMFSIPVFAHSLVLDETPRSRNVIAGAVSAIALILLISTFNVDMANEHISQSRGLALYLALTMFYLMVLYSTGLKLAHWKRMDADRRAIARSITVMNIIFLPGIIYDWKIYVTHKVVIFVPLFYCLFSVLFTLYVAKRYFTGLKLIAAEIAVDSLDSSLAGTGISSRERDIIELMLEGLGNKDIAERLFISLNTVKTHNRNIFRKMNVGSRFELVMKLKNTPPE
jgi:DNA-binding CsgD family transcriptional regulator/methionine-rich copper-binding protein CopC